MQAVEPEGDHVRSLLDRSESSWRAGDLPASVGFGWQAYDEALRTRQPAMRARAALALAAPPETGLSDEKLIRALTDTLADPGIGSQPRVRVQARLAAALHAAGRPEAAGSQLEEAVRAMQGLGAHDADLRCFVLRCRQWLLSAPEDQQRRRAGADQLVEVAQELGSAEQLMWAHGWRLSALLSDGDLPGAGADGARCRRLAERLDEPFHRSCAWMWASPLAGLRGDLAEAERSARRAWTREVTLGFEQHLLALQLWEPFRLQGRLAELHPQLEPLVDVDEPIWQTTVPLGRLAVGDRAGAERLFLEQMSGVAALPRDLYWLFGIGVLSLTCVALEERPAAEVLYDLLLPFESRLCDAAGIATCGPAALHLGALAGLLGDAATARRHLDTALAWATDVGARAYVPQVRQAQRLLPVSDRWTSLTAAERRVADLVAEGLTNAEVARRLALSRYTVETHLKRVFAKLELRSRAALAAEVVRRRT